MAIIEWYWYTQLRGTDNSIGMTDFIFVFKKVH